MSYTFIARSGKNAQVRIGAGGSPFVFTAKKWTVTPRVSESDTSNFETGGFEDLETGIVGLDVTIEFDWDASQATTPYDAPPNIQPGQTITVKIYINGTGGPFWNIPNFKVLQTPNMTDPRSMISGTLTGKAKPTWSFPTGPI